MRAWLLLAMLSLLAACAGPPTRQTPPSGASTGRIPPPPTGARPDQPGEYTPGGLYKPGVPDGGPAIPPDISGLKEPVPRDEPRARYGNRSPYTVLGRSYHVMEDARGYVERGVASWYGEKFHGRATSSMEPYDMYAFTAAHKTLPLPTYARVTNLENGRSVIVRVNDRGPFHEGRLIDLSYAAAIKLGIHVRGTGPVEVRALVGGDADAPAPATRVATPAAAATTAQRTWVQVASFGDKDNAARLVERLQRARVDKVKIERARVRGERVYRVRIGPFADRAIAEHQAGHVRALGLGQPALVTE